MEFLPGDRVIANPLRISNSYPCEIEASLIVCFTGQSRAAAIIQDQIKAATENNQDAIEAMHQLKSDAVAMKQALLGGNIPQIADVLNRSKALSSMRSTTAPIIPKCASKDFGNGTPTASPNRA